MNIVVNFEMVQIFWFVTKNADFIYVHQLFCKGKNPFEISGQDMKNSLIEWAVDCHFLTVNFLFNDISQKYSIASYIVNFHVYLFIRRDKKCMLFYPKIMHMGATVLPKIYFKEAIINRDNWDIACIARLVPLKWIVKFHDTLQILISGDGKLKV